MSIPVRSRLAGVVVAGALAMTVGAAGTAFADDTTATAMDVAPYVTASNSPASQAAPEILGISGVDELQAFPKDIYTDLTGNAGLKYLLMGTTEYNISPNPYFYNYVNNVGTKVVDNTDKRRKGYTNEMGNPVRALAPYGGLDESDNKVWEQLPDIIIGNVVDGAGTQVTYLEAEYAPAVIKALNLADGSYTPIASTYTLNSMADIVDKTYELAENANTVIEKSNGAKHTRYGDTTAIAANYEKYVKATQGYILSQLEKSGAEKKTVAVVSGTNDDGTLSLRVTPLKFATASRFLEITTLVANNYADTLEVASGANTVSVTKDQLANCDLIILETGASKADMGDLAVKTYWADTNNTGAIYKVDANSVEIGTNYGRILGCLYPEYVDQSDWVAYYYDNFYHVKADKLAGAIDLGMDGVRNWNITSGTASDLLKWTTKDVADYNEATVDQKLNEGIQWIQAKGEDANALIQLDSKYSAFYALSSENTTVTFNTESETPTVTVSYKTDKGDVALTEGEDYTLSLAKDATDATKWVATITGTGQYVGSTEASCTVAKEDVTATRLAGDEAYQTSVAISTQAFEDGACDTVILARDDDFADAMSASGLAGAYEAPILLIDRNNGASQEVLDELTRLGAKTVYIIGGTGAIPANVEGQFTGYTVERIFGNEAWDTSVECAKRITAKTGEANSYGIVAMSDNFQDALSMSSFAYAYKVPIILETSGATAADRQLPEGGLEVLNAASAEVFVAGGTGALSDASIAGITSVTPTRLWGDDGFDTSNQIATYMTQKGYLQPVNVTIANGSEAAKGLDALAGSALAGKNKGVMLLAQGSSEHADTLGEVDTTTITGSDSRGTTAFLEANASTVAGLNVLGGTYVMPDSFVADVEKVVNGE